MSSAANAFVTKFCSNEMKVAEEALSNLEIVWLNERLNRSDPNDDESVNRHYDIFVGKQLKPMHVTEFVKVRCCSEYIYAKKNVFLILSNISSEQELSKLCNCPNILLIYHFGLKDPWLKGELVDISPFNQWFHRLSTILGRVADCDFYSVARKAVTAPLNETDDDSRTFVIFQLLIEILLRSPITEKCRTDFINTVEQIYVSNGRFQADIEEFKSNYTPDKAIDWYTRSSFPYRILSLACCTGNIQRIFKVRAYIHDLYNELKLLHEESVSRAGNKLQVFRGKAMLREQLCKLQESVGDFVVTRTFLSTSTDEGVAQFHAGENHINDTVGVIFRMTIDTHANKTKPFAYIKSKSRTSDENEVLLPIGIVFRNIAVKKTMEYQFYVELLRDFEAETLERKISHTYFNSSLDTQAEYIRSMSEFFQVNQDTECSGEFIQHIIDRTLPYVVPVLFFDPECRHSPASSPDDRTIIYISDIHQLMDMLSNSNRVQYLIGICSSDFRLILHNLELCSQSVSIYLCPTHFEGIKLQPASAFHKTKQTYKFESPDSHIEELLILFHSHADNAESEAALVAMTRLKQCISNSTVDAQISSEATP